MIAVRDLRVDYDEVCAVRDLSLQIPPGEVFGLIGPNGAGKTTTLRTLTGLQEPTYGDITLGGYDLATMREQAVSQVGFMPDFAPVYPDLTVWEFLDLFAASYLVPVDRRARVIDHYLKLVDLTEKRDAMTAGLSRGMKQRLMLAKTLLPEPRIVLLDEPASGMDPHGRALLRDILTQLAAEGRTVLISSHILVELSEFCTSVGVMEKGRMVISGRITDVAAKVIGTTQITADVLAGADIMLRLLEADPRVSGLNISGRMAGFAFAGDDDATADLLASLVAAGVRLAAFGRKKEDLEDVFLKIGAKEVS